MKKPRWYAWATALAVLALLIDIYAFAGLGRVPGVGERVAAQARLQSPLMDTYLVAGRYTLRATPFMRGVSDALAASTWGRAFEPIRRKPSLALYLLDSQADGLVHDLMVPIYWAPAVLFLLALLGWWRRPRKVSLMGGNRR